jgi:tRNA-2-methylthio-N6-dimethylallyladenosine synthase
MNERDSEAVAAQLVAKGYALAASEATADVILLNTCSVRDAAEQKALGKMRSLVGEVKRQRPGVVLGFMGCMAQSRGQELVARLPDLDLVIGTQKFHRTAEYLADVLAGRRRQIVDIAEEEGSASAIREHLLGAESPRRSVTAFLSIMQGCNQHCAFCIVPQTRGAERSRPIAEIVAEGAALAASGVKEVTLLGQIVTSYGKREIPLRHGRTGFVQLLEAVQQIDGLERIRFTSPHPKGYGEDLVEAYGRLSKLCEWAHLPVQSGSNRVLKAMRRGYTREKFLSLVSQLRRVKPAIGLTTDIIAGFPGETEADFEETLALVREAQFDSAYAFKFSPRRDTPAAQMSGQLPSEVIAERHGRLLRLVTEIGARKYRESLDHLEEVLVEGPSRRNPNRLEGRTRTNRLVVFEGAPRHIGQILKLRVVRVGTFTLYGDPAVVNLPAEWALDKGSGSGS